MQTQTAQATAIALRNQELISKNTQTMRYTGTSMLPLISAGDSLTISRIGIGKLAFGDIVAYEFKNQIYINRFLFLYRNALIVKGDNRHNFRRISQTTYTGRVEFVQTPHGPLSLRTPLLRAVSYTFALCSGVEGCLYRMYCLRPKVKPGITVVAYCFSLLSSLLNIRPSVRDVSDR